MDLLLFPTYVWICHGLKKPLIQSSWLSILVCFLLSFLLGQLIDLPFLLFSKEVTVLYWVMGLKTSLIQGFISAVLTAFLFEPVCDRIHKLQGERK